MIFRNNLATSTYNTCLIMDEIFLQACKTGDLATIEYILTNVNIHTRSVGIGFASRNGHLKIVKYLVEQGVDFQTCNNHAVQMASVSGHLEIVKYLVGKSANFRDASGEAFRSAVMEGHLDVVQYLVEKGVGRNLLNYAVRIASCYGHLEVVKYLIEKGANFRVGNNEAVHTASRECHFKVVKYLVEQGAPEDLISDEARDYIIRRNKVKWSLANHSDFSASTNKLFGTLFLGIQRLEETRVVPLAHQAMLEDILEGWSVEDDF